MTRFAVPLCAVYNMLSIEIVLDWCALDRAQVSLRILIYANGTKINVQQEHYTSFLWMSYSWSMPHSHSLLFLRHVVNCSFARSLFCFSELHYHMLWLYNYNLHLSLLSFMSQAWSQGLRWIYIINIFIFLISQNTLFVTLIIWHTLYYILFTNMVHRLCGCMTFWRAY